MQVLIKSDYIWIHTSYADRSFGATLCKRIITTTQNPPLMQASCLKYVWNGSAHLVNHLIWGGRRAGIADTHFMA